MGQVEVGLQLRLLSPSAIQIIQLLDCRLRPDAETSNMATRSQLQQVELVDGDQINSRDVTESLGQTRILAIDDQRSKLAGAATVAHLALASTESAALVHLNEFMEIFLYLIFHSTISLCEKS